MKIFQFVEIFVKIFSPGKRYLANNSPKNSLLLRKKSSLNLKQKENKRKILCFLHSTFYS